MASKKKATKKSKAEASAAPADAPAVAVVSTPVFGSLQPHHKPQKR